MGVSGAGKTTIGQLVARELGYPFYDADDFHGPANIAKMSQGIALCHEDRAPWLAALAVFIREHLDRGESMVLACSALSERHRKLLGHGRPDVVFVYLKGDYELVLSRLKGRSGHYMKASLLDDQFALLEEPSEAIVVDIDSSTDEIVETVVRALDSSPG